MELYEHVSILEGRFAHFTHQANNLWLIEEAYKQSFGGPNDPNKVIILHLVTVEVHISAKGSRWRRPKRIIAIDTSIDELCRIDENYFRFRCKRDKVSLTVHLPESDLVQVLTE